MAPKINTKKRTISDEDWTPSGSDSRLAKRKMASSSVGNILPKSESTAKVKPKHQEIIDLSEEGPNIVGKMMYKPTMGFPRFNDGDVYIELKQFDKIYSYRLHRGVLCWNSNSFVKELNQPWDDLDNEMATEISHKNGICYRFELFNHPKLGFEVLRRTNLTEIDDGSLKNLFRKAKHLRSATILSAATRVESVDSSNSTVSQSTSTPTSNASELASPGIGEREKIDISISSPKYNKTETNRCEPDGKKNIDTEIQAGEAIVQGPEALNLAVETNHCSTSSSEAQNSQVDIKVESRTSPLSTELEDCPVATKTKNEIESIVPETQDVPADIKKDNNSVENAGLKTKVVMHEQAYSSDERAGLVRIKNPRQEILDAYNNLFSTFYNTAPTINTADINIALGQLELLVMISEACCSLSTVIPHINSILFQFQHELPKAILSNPPRWMLFSVKIKSSLIYREAMIHIAGSYPVWPLSNLTNEDLPIRIVQFIELTQTQTALLRSEVDKKLFCNSISSLPENGGVIAKDKINTTAWLSVQFWRDWFTKATSSASTMKKEDTGNQDATLYRLLAQGGEAYLPLHSVMAEFATLRVEEGKLGVDDMADVSKYLTILKKQAQEIVAPLCINNLLLSVEEADIKYLTCHKVVNDDLPWVLLPEEFDL